MLPQRMIMAASNPANQIPAPPVYAPVYLDYGYFGGGFVFPGGQRSTVDRIDYSNDTASAISRGPLTFARSYLAGTGNSSYGYFGGGITSPGTVRRTTVDRLDFSNDSVATVAKGPLSLARYRHAATGNSSYGYFGGGYAPSQISTIERIDYANDTATGVAKGPLTAVLSSFSSTSNSSYGYFGGGTFPVTSNTNRIDYSNDTVTTLVRGRLSSARYSVAGVSNSSYGYFAGGSISPATNRRSTVDRLDYANDTATASLRGPLTLARTGAGGTGNASYGYFSGGFVFPGSPRSTTDRIDYANDTPSATAKGPLSVARSDMGDANDGPV